jgi:outer membrane protein assembly factor BamD
LEALPECREGFFINPLTVSAVFSVIFAGFMKIGKLLLPILVLFLASCSQYSKILKSTDYDYKLKMANQYYDQKKYNKAKGLYEELFSIFKGTPQFEDLYYRYAFCHYNTKDYPSAENLFKGYLEVFPNAARSDEVEYMQAYSYFRDSPKPELDQSNTVKAMGMMQTFINTHPGSAKLKDAEKVVDLCAQKLETKELAAAQLYYNMGQYRAAGIAFNTLLNDFPDSKTADQYKLLIVKSYYQFAKLSVPEKQQMRYEKVVTEVQDFQDRFPESKLLKDAERFLTLSQSNIKSLSK